MIKNLVVIIFIGINSIVSGQVTGELFQVDGSDLYCAAVRTSSFHHFQAHQEKTNWCWAACAEMVLDYQGLNISQEDIVLEGYGNLANQPASCDLMQSVMDGWTHNGNTIKARTIHNPTPKKIIDP